MTTLESTVVARGNNYRIIKWVAGDLSYSYLIIINGINFTTTSLANAKRLVAYFKRNGKAATIRFEQRLNKGKRFPTLRGKEAMRLAKSKRAYGNYVKQLRRRKKR